MGLFATLKHNSKRALSGNWGKAIAIFLIIMLSVSIFAIFETALRFALNIPEFIDLAQTPHNYIDDALVLTLSSVVITLLISLAILFVLIPLKMGQYSWHYSLTGGKSEDVKSLFGYFETGKRFRKAIWVHVNIGFRMFFWSMLLFLPFTVGMVLYVFFQSTTFFQIDNMIGMVLGLSIGWVLIAAIILSIISNKYFLAPYYLFEDEDMKVSVAIKMSRLNTRGHKCDLFLFSLSFIGWSLLCIFIIPLFYVIPYQQTAFAMYARYLIHMGKPFDQKDATQEFPIDENTDVYREESSALSANESIGSTQQFILQQQDGHGERDNTNLTE